MFSQFFSFIEKSPVKKPAAKADVLQVGSQAVPLLFVQHPRARRYLLRLRPDGVARVTVPRRGSLVAAREFVHRNIGWLERQLRLQADRPKSPALWRVGTEIQFRGGLVRIEAAGPGVIYFGPERLKVPELELTADLRPVIQKHLRTLAQLELPDRTIELAALHQVAVARVSVRNQRSRWGSCSSKGTISLNWRLIQTPAYVQDYIILHELAHRRQMNHSVKFWQEVERLCPNYPAAEQWLKAHGKLLR
jgi:predicted metal-dependent hydrolase